MRIIPIFLLSNFLGFYVGTYLGGFLHSLFAATATERAWWILAAPMWLVLLALGFMMFIMIFELIEFIHNKSRAMDDSFLGMIFFYNAFLGLWLGRLIDPIYLQSWNPSSWSIGLYGVFPLLATMLTVATCIKVAVSPVYRTA